MSEKRKPHYDLRLIKATFSTPEKLQATGVAQRDSKAIGYGNDDIVRVIQSIELRHFYKSMTANHNAQA